MNPRIPAEPVDRLKAFVQNNPTDAHKLMHRLTALGRPLLLRSDLVDAFRQLCDSDEISQQAEITVAESFQTCQEAIVNHAWIVLAFRRRVARWSYLRIHVDTMSVEEIPVKEFLRIKEQLIVPRSEEEFTLEIDLAPFDQEFYKLQEQDSIGRGVEFLNRRLSSHLFEEMGKKAQHVLEFLRVHHYRNQQLMLNDKITSLGQLRDALRYAEELLDDLDSDVSWDVTVQELRHLGFEPGWGRNAQRTRETMRLLLEILQAPSPDNLEAFLGRVPMIFSLAILSPHGFFGQSNVLGRPDTGGQVVYILDQVRALEQEMYDRLYEQGLDIEPQIKVITRLIPESDGTTSDQRLEHIAGTRYAHILRVPFRSASGEIKRKWISRFDIWPYLERFSIDAEHELLAELGGRPDLIIGNYSDGNLVASLMSRRLGVTQCNIAHALEKTKYLYSDLYWKDNEPQYHFSCQFTADLIAMNTADFIITSTYQEIAGTRNSLGQYESYASFTMPGLYRVLHGIDVYDPKFNIVSPGADSEVYFPYTQKLSRFSHLHDEIESLIYGDDDGESSRGVLLEQEKPLIFTLARMDRIKNVTGLVEWYAQNADLREEANLLVAAGHIDPDDSGDEEERTQIKLMHELIDEYGLDGQVRWLERQVDKERNSEVYRYIADKKGVFVQPALFEAFGLTVIEAMGCGLPTFATCYGGPAEIIVDGKSGFHIDPNHGDRAAQRIARFLQRCREEPDYWESISQGGLDRVNERYTWRLYAERMMTLSRVYGFWKHVSGLKRTETRRHLEMFYALQYRPLAAALETGSEE
jgi:sucrose synthase